MNEATLRRTEYSNEWTPKYLYLVASVFVTTIVVSNIAAAKLFQFGPFVFTAGIIIFPISYIFGDILTEVYGFVRARRVIYCGLIANLFTAGILTIAIYLPPAQGWPLQEQFAAIHSLMPRIVLASIIGYVAGELANSIIMSLLKIRTGAKHLWIRTISSTFVGQFVDTALFVLVGFAGIFPSGVLGKTIISGWLFKVIYEIIATPFTYLIVGKLKKLEGIEHFDIKDKYNIFKF